MNTRIAVAILLTASAAYGQTWTMPNAAYFQTNVFLHDADTTPLHTRIPTGAVLTVEGAYLRPAQAVTLQGNLTLETNRTFTMSHKPDVSDVTNSVVIDANGQIILRRWVTGTGWIEATINPTNPLPAAMTPSGTYVEKSGDTMSGILDMGGNSITNIGSVSSSGSATSFFYRAIFNEVLVSTTQFNWKIRADVDGTTRVFPVHVFRTYAPISGITIATNQLIYNGGLVFDGSVTANHVRANFAGCGASLTNIPASGIAAENSYTGGTMRLITTNGTTFRWE